MATDDATGANAFIMSQQRVVRSQAQGLPQLFRRQASPMYSYAPAGTVAIEAGRAIGSRSVTLPAGSAGHRAYHPRTQAHASKGRSQTASAGVKGFPSTAYCVRLCDGYFFPLGGGVGKEQQEEACAAICPAAATRVYFGEAGRDISTARSIAGKRYEDLATAFQHRSGRDQACSCSARGWGVARVPLQDDLSLRKGDIVMTSEGLRIFQGNRQGQSDRVTLGPLSDAAGLDKQRQAKLRGIESASVVRSAPAGARFAAASVRRDKPPGVAGRERVADVRVADARFGRSTSDASDVAPATAGPSAPVRYVGPGPRR